MALDVIAKGKTLPTIRNQELIGDADVIAPKEFGDSFSMALASQARSGEIVKVLSYVTSDSTLIRENFEIHFFDTNPTLTAGLSTFTAAKAQKRVSQVSFASADFATGLSGIMLGHKDVASPFFTNASGILYGAVQQQGTSTWNSTPSANQVLVSTITFRFDN